VLREVANAQIARRQAETGKPLASLEAALGQEYLKGEISGMRTLLALPEIMLSATKPEPEPEEEPQT
jgi:hypothetical protein